MITRKDIAEKAGVSVSIVSRALNNSGYVAKDKKEKVIRIATEMEYYPNPVAMSLQTRKTSQIIFCCKDLRNSFNIEMYQAMIEEAKKRNYLVVLSGRLDFEQIKTMMVDGIILPSRAVAERYLKFCGKNYYLPMVTASYLEAIPLSKSVPIVEVDLFKGMELAIEYLRKNGHSKIAFGVPEVSNNCYDSRTIAYKEILQPILKNKILDYIFSDSKTCILENKISFEEWEVDEDFFEKGVMAAQLFVEKRSDATAVVCYNDEFALGMVRQFKKMGVRVPQDVSIVGFDSTYNRKHSELLITSVGLFPEKIGAKCVEVLLDMIEGKNNKYIIHSPIKLIEGESVRNIANM